MQLQIHLSVTITSNFKQDAVGTGKLGPQCRQTVHSAKHLPSDWCCHLANSTKHIRVVFDADVFRALYKK